MTPHESDPTGASETKPPSDDLPWQCSNPQCRAAFAEYVNGCPRCATGEPGGSHSVVLVAAGHKVPASAATRRREQ